MQWIIDGLKVTGKKRGDLAKALKRQGSAVTALLNGTRRLQIEEIPIIEDFLGIKAPVDLLTDEGVPVVGYVGAGFAAHFYEPHEDFVTVPRPPNATNTTVAVLVRGESMRGTAEDGWVLYYDKEPGPITDDMIGELCIVWCADGRVLAKKPKKGSAPNRFHLESTNADTMYDVDVINASLVDWIKPRRNKL